MVEKSRDIPFVTVACGNSSSITNSHLQHAVDCETRQGFSTLRATGVWQIDSTYRGSTIFRREPRLTSEESPPRSDRVQHSVQCVGEATLRLVKHSEADILDRFQVLQASVV